LLYIGARDGILYRERGTGMKVERISDTQVKITLYASDLSDRDINITELAYATDKTANLFREMMERAVSQCGFKFPNSPLMIEATPLSLDSLLLIISVIDEKNLDRASGMNFLKELSKFREQPKKSFDGAKGKIKKAPQESALAYNFASIDEVVAAAKRLTGLPALRSSLIKKDGSYYLVVETDTEEHKPYVKDYEAVLSEYGRKVNANALFIPHLKEHGEPIINEGAVIKLSRI